MSVFFRTKPIETESLNNDSSLKRSLSATALVSLGIGGIIGAGIFMRTAAAAGGHAGPAVTISFIIAAVGCAFAGLCYAEFASMLPTSGSAYSYSYATMGELIAWIIGWDLVLEYALGAATVAIAWSQYLNNILYELFQVRVPYSLSHSPFETSPEGVSGLINLPAVFVLLAMTLLLIRGTQESAFVNNIIVMLKLMIVLLFIGLGWQFINADNHVPYMISETAGKVPLSTGGEHDYSLFGNNGWSGVLRGAGIVFFAFIGFDAVSTAAQEAKNPKRDMPIGILGSLVLCTILYILFSHVLTGIAPYKFFMGAGKEASVAAAINAYMPASYHWLSTFITAAILFGFSSVILVLLLGQTRVFYSMSKDGLVPKIFSDVHPKYRSPYKSQWLFFVFVSLFAAFVPDSVVGDMTSIGTLFAFILVCVGIIILRRKNPSLPRPFRTPFVPLVPLLGVAFCLAMIAGLGVGNWIRLFVWLLIGFVIYFFYSIKHSKLNGKKS